MGISKTGRRYTIQTRSQARAERKAKRARGRAIIASRGHRKAKKTPSKTNVDITTGTKDEGVRKAIIERMTDKGQIIEKGYGHKYQKSLIREREKKENVRLVIGRIPEKDAWTEMVSPEVAEGVQKHYQRIGAKRLIEENQPFHIQWGVEHPSAPLSDWDKFQKRIDVTRTKIDFSGKDFSSQIKDFGGKVPIEKAWLYPATFSMGVLSTAGSLTKAITNPVQTVKGLGYAVTHPKQTLLTIGKHAKANPIMFAGEVTAFYGFSKALGYGVKKMPKLKFENLKVATGKTKTSTLYRGVGWEYKTKGGGIIGVSKGKLKLGTPKVNFKGVKGSFIPETPLQREILFKSLTKTEIAKPKLMFDVMKRTYKTPSKFVRKQFVLDSKTLTKVDVNKIIKWSKSNKAEVYGSFPAQSQMPKALSRPFGDIDVFLKTTGKSGQVKAMSLSKSLGKGFRIKKGATLIEKKIGGKYVHAVDIHTLDSAADVLSPAYAGQKVYGLPLNQKLIKIQGVKAMPLSEQGLRKGASIGTARFKDGVKFAPEAHRFKDIGDFFNVQKTLILSKKTGGKAAEASLKKLSKLYPKSQRGYLGNVKVSLYSPSKATTKMVVSPFLSVGIGKSKPVSVSSVSRGKYKPKSVSVSPSLRKSMSLSISKSPSISKSVSPSLSKSPSPSISKSLSPSLSPSLSLSLSPSPSLSKSLSPSPSRSPSPYPSFPHSTTKLLPPLVLPKLIKPSVKKGKRSAKRKYSYQPSLFAVGKNIFGKQPKFLTGIEVRPII